MLIPEPAEIQARLQELVAYAREDLHIELKGWLNIWDKSNQAKENQANIAQAILALANHGGGYILIGFDERDGTWWPASNRPSDLTGYTQDAINAIVHHFAEPVFHCHLHHVKHPLQGDLFPVIVVPGDHKVPVQSKAQGSNGKHVQMNCYYIRRPGPKSEQIKTAQEWDVLLNRCLRMRRDDLLSDFRTLLYGLDNPLQYKSDKTEDQLSTWVDRANERFDELVEEHKAEGSPTLYQHGYWTLAYEIKGEFAEISRADLLRKMADVEKHTGWPVWIILNRTNLSPEPYNDVIECWLKDTLDHDPSTSDFWWASPKGSFFLLRGYDDDSPRARVTPGTCLDPTLRVLRTGECLLHAESMARQLGVKSGRIAIKACWKGLGGRRLDPWSNPIILVPPFECRTDTISSEIAVTLDEMTATLPEVVERLLRPLFESFNFYEMSIEGINHQLTRLKGQTFRR